MRSDHSKAQVTREIPDKQILTDPMVEDVFSGNAREVLGQGERAHDPAVPVDDRSRNSDTFIHKTLNRGLGLVDV